MPNIQTIIPEPGQIWYATDLVERYPGKVDSASMLKTNESVKVLGVENQMVNFQFLAGGGSGFWSVQKFTEYMKLS